MELGLQEAVLLFSAAFYREKLWKLEEQSQKMLCTIDRAWRVPTLEQGIGLCPLFVVQE